MKTITIKGIKYVVISQRESPYKKTVKQGMSDVKTEILLIKRPKGIKTFITFCYSWLSFEKPFIQFSEPVKIPQSEF